MVSLSDFTLEDGEYLVKLSRKAVETFLKTGVKIVPPKDVPEKFWEKFGVFVTIERLGYVGSKVYKELRGCIGFTAPILPLYQTVMRACLLYTSPSPRD